jgi:hypothetical protein
MGVSELLLVFALICFLIAAFGERYTRQIRVGWLGLAFWVASLLIRR